MLMSRRLLGPLLVAPVLSRAQAAGRATSRLSERRAPVTELSFTDADGQATSLGAFRGEGLVINLWATWCPPCVAEMPSLDRLQAAVHAEGIRVLALSSDRGGRAVVEAFYRRLEIRHLGLWLDPRGAAARSLGARGLPTTVILDRSGDERARMEGEAEWDAPVMVEAIRRLVRP